MVIIDSLIRDIAQLGRAPALGAGCRRFKSYYPDILWKSQKFKSFQNLEIERRIECSSVSMFEILLLFKS